MGNKYYYRKKSHKARKIINRKNVLQRYLKKSTGQPQKSDTDDAAVMIPAESNDNSNIDIVTCCNIADISKNSFIELDPVDPQQTVTLVDAQDTEDSLIMDNEGKEDEFRPISGRRIIDINYFLQELQEKARHNGLFDCTLGNFRLISEKRRGLISVFRFECNMCKQICLISSEDQNYKEQVNLNIAATTGIVASGIGFSQFEELCSAMDIPVFGSTYYSKLEDEVFEKWKTTASASMEAAVQMEKDIAIAEGRIKNGYPLIDVYVDGSWCARSYGAADQNNTLYNSCINKPF